MFLNFNVCGIYFLLIKFLIPFIIKPTTTDLKTRDMIFFIINPPKSQFDFP